MNQKNKVKTQDIVVMYTVQHLTMQEIATLTQVSKQVVYKRLHQFGIQTKDGTWVRLLCDFCGRDFTINRSRWRKAGNIHFYCSSECYYASIENPNYIQWRQGQRLARVIVNQYFKLDPDNIVHHKDGDTRNNNLSNLLVYLNNADHIKATHHKNHTVQPVWDGANPLGEGPLHDSSLALDSFRFL